MSSPFGDRTEISAEEYRAWLAGQGQTVFVPPAAIEIEPDWRTSEKAFLQKVTDYARERRWRVYHTWKSANSSPGFPDLVFLRAGVLGFAELKVGDNKPTKPQQDWLADLAAVNSVAFVALWYPDDWPTIEEVLR
jgi:hypothetical protein